MSPGSYYARMHEMSRVFDSYTRASSDVYQICWREFVIGKGILCEVDIFQESGWRESCENHPESLTFGKAALRSGLVSDVPALWKISYPYQDE